MSAEANKAIKDMTHEEALEGPAQVALQRRLVANARVHEAMERVTQTHDVPTHVDVHGDHLVRSVRGKELAMTFLTIYASPWSTCGASRQTRRSSIRCGGDGEYPASTCLGSGSTMCMVIETRPS